MIRRFHRQRQRVNREEMLLNTGHHGDYLEIEAMVVSKEPYDRLWQAAVNFHAEYEKWMNSPFLEVNAEEVAEEVIIIIIIIVFFIATTHG